MIYLVAIFCSPLALLLIGKPFQAAANLALYGLAFLFWISIFLFHFGFLVWLIAVVHAILAINSYKADKRNEDIIAAMSDYRGREPTFESIRKGGPGDFSPS
jgi:hypothetical protein